MSSPTKGARARRLAALLGVALACAASGAFAQSDSDKATARALATEGERALVAKDYKTAEDRFGRADKLFHAPTLVLGFARAEVGLGKLVSAQEAYNRVLREPLASNAPSAYTEAVADAKKELKAIEPKIAWLVLQVTGAGAKDAAITVDGESFPSAAIGVKRAIDPGQHVVRADVRGGAPVERPVVAGEGATVDVTLDVAAPAGGVAPPPSGLPPIASAPSSSALPPPPPPARDAGGPPYKVLGFASLGLGAAGAIAGGIFGGVAIGKHNDLANVCNAKTKLCTTSYSDAIDSYHLMGTLSTVGFIVAGVGVAGGVTLLVLAPSSSAPPARVSVSPRGVTIAGAF